MALFPNTAFKDKDQSNIPLNFTEKPDVNKSTPRLHNFSKKINKAAKMSEKDQYHLLRPATVASKSLG